MARNDEFDSLDLPAQEAARAEQERAQNLEREIEAADLKFVLSTIEGRRFMWRLLDKAGVFRSSFSLNGLQMAHNEGNRNIGLMLISEIHEHSPNRYMEMVKEHRKKNEHRAKRST